MKSFTFRLEQYLKIKEFEEKSSWNEVLKQEGRAAILKNKIDNLMMLQKENKGKLALAGKKNGTTIYETDLIHEFINASDAKIVLLNNEYFTELKTLEKLKIKHLEVKKELKTIENLKEKKLQEYNIQVNKNEAKQTALIANQMFNRGRAKNG